MLASELATRLEGRLLDGDLDIADCRSIAKAESYDLVPVLRPKDILSAKKSNAGCVLASFKDAANHAASFSASVIAVEDVFLSFARVIELFVPGDKFTCKGKIGFGTKIHASAFVGESAFLGDNCQIRAGAKILGNTTLGHNVIVGANCVLGGAAFVFAPNTDGSSTRVLATKGIVIEDNVELGSCVCIDHGVLEPTIIKSGVKIDNLVQIAHDAFIGNDTMICGQSGVAGYAKVGKRCVLGGQSGVSSHVEIGNDVRIDGKSAVFKNVGSGLVVGGNPAMLHGDFLNFSLLRPKLKALIKRASKNK